MLSRSGCRGTHNVYHPFGIIAGVRRMKAGPSVGAATYNATSLTVDDDRLDEVFEREVFSPTLDDESVVSSADELEVVLGLSVYEEGSEGERSEPTAAAEADAEVEADAESGRPASEAETDASATEGAAEPSAAQSDAEADAADGQEAQPGDATAAGSPAATASEDVLAEGQDGREAGPEYSALRRLRSITGGADESASGDGDGRDRMDRYGVPNGSERGEPESKTESGGDDAALPVVANSRSRVASFVSQVRNMFR